MCKERLDRHITDGEVIDAYREACELIDQKYSPNDHIGIDMKAGMQMLLEELSIHPDEYYNCDTVEEKHPDNCTCGHCTGEDRALEAMERGIVEAENARIGDD